MCKNGKYPSCAATLLAVMKGEKVEYCDRVAEALRIVSKVMADEQLR